MDFGSSKVIKSRLLAWEAIDLGDLHFDLEITGSGDPSEPITARSLFNKSGL